MRETTANKWGNAKKKPDWKKKFGDKKKQSSVEDEEIELLNAKIQELKSSNLEAFAKAVKTFSDFPLSSKTLKGLTSAKFETPTEIQRCSILPGLLGFDVLGGAKTGSGKTLAFLVPILEKLYKEKWSRREGLGALIVSPTRELALQTFKVLKLINKFHDYSVELVIGGKFLKEERDRILETNIVICTPGRLQQHLETTVNFRADNLQILVLDEADRILDLGFQQQMTEIAENLPVERQTLFFSATQTRMVRDLARVSMRVPVVAFTSDLRRQISPTPHSLKQNYVICPPENKLNMLWSFVKNYLKSKMVVFFATCKQVRFVHESFRRLRPGTTVLALHSKMKYTKRMSMFETFVRKQRAVLFATDIVARGLDFPDVDWVVHMDCPTDITTYIHRSGRTARCDKQGTALLVLLPSEEQEMVRLLAQKKIPIKKIKVDRKKQFSITQKLSSLCAADVTLKEFAQRSFVSYLKSVAMASNKKMFDVTQLNLEPFALSLGLACAPTVRFANKHKAQKSIAQKPPVSSDSDESDDSSDGASSSEHEPAEKNDSELKDGFANDDDRDDELFVKKTEPGLMEENDEQLTDTELRNNQSAKNKMESKYAAAKKVLKKKLTVNSKIVFDEEGKPVTDAYRQAQDTEDVSPVELCETGGIDIEKAKNRLIKEDLFDKKLYREKVQLKHRERRLKEKEKRRQKRHPEMEENNEPAGEPDLDFLPDPDKIYGPAKDDDSDGEKTYSKTKYGDESSDSDADFSLKVRKSKRHDDDDDGFDSCEYDEHSSSNEETNQKNAPLHRSKKTKRSLPEAETKQRVKKTKKRRRNDDDDLDTGLSLVDDEAIALKLLGGL